MIYKTWSVSLIAAGKPHDTYEVITNGVLSEPPEKIPEARQQLYFNEVHTLVSAQYKHYINEVNSKIAKLECIVRALENRVDKETDIISSLVPLKHSTKLVKTTSNLDEWILALSDNKVDSTGLTVLQGDPASIQVVREANIEMKRLGDKLIIELHIVKQSETHVYEVNKQSFGVIDLYVLSFIRVKGCSLKQNIVAILNDGSRIAKLSNGSYRRYRFNCKDLTNTKQTRELTEEDISSTNVDKDTILTGTRSEAVLQHITKGI